MIFRQLYDQDTSTYTYLLADERTHQAVLIDPVREQAPRDLALVKELGLKLTHALDTHAHADHITGAGLLRDATGCKVVVSRHAGVQGADREVDDGDAIDFGGQTLEVRATPGHTDGCVSYITADRKMAFTGDALLIRKSGRTDFQQGDARKLYRSVREKIFTLPDDTRVFPGHDYQGHLMSTVGEEKIHNPRLAMTITEDRFAEIMADLKLPPPRYLEKAVPANLRCGLTEEEFAQGTAPRQPEGPWAPVTRSPTGVPEVDIAWVKEHGCRQKMVDVREVHEFNGDVGHIAGAELVPLSMVADVAHGWNRDEPLVVICRSGGRSGMAAMLLESMGFYKIASMRGGMLGWVGKKYPVDRLEPGNLSTLRDEVFSCFVAMQGGDVEKVKPDFTGVFTEAGVDYNNPTADGLENVLERLHHRVVSQGFAREAADLRLNHFKRMVAKAV